MEQLLAYGSELILRHRGTVVSLYGSLLILRHHGTVVSLYGS